MYIQVYTLNAFLLGCAQEYGERDRRETIRRIISARRSNRRERSAYDEAYDQEA